MFKRPLFVTLVFALTALTAFLGCGSDDPAGPSGPTPSDFSGSWDLSFEVVAKRVCSREVGAVVDETLVITQQGANAEARFQAGVVIPLAVVGNRATGTSDGDFDADLDLTITDGALSGTLTLRATVGEAETPCTEVFEISGARSNDPPSPAFAGNWDLVIQTTSTTCDGEFVGETEQICLTIALNGNTVSITDEDGVITGVGDGNTAVLFRGDSDSQLEVTLTVSGNALTGTAQTLDIQDDCSTTQSVTGTRRSGPCETTSSDGFEGPWDLVVTVTSSECFDEEQGESFATCMTASVSGSSISLEDGSQDGPITGTISGNTATLSRTNAQGTLSITLNLDGDEVFGTAVMNYSSGVCAETTVQYAVAGSRSDGPCGSVSGGDFAGSWDVDVEITLNECGFQPNPSCELIEQSGNTVFLTGDGLQGTVSGNTLTVFEQETVEGVTITIQVTLELSPGANSFTGTQTITFFDSANPEEECQTSANLTGTRVSECPAFAPSPSPKKVRGFLAEMP